MSREKKLRAAMTAVVAYMQEEQAARAASVPPRESDTAWAMHGRTTIMNNRAMWQRAPHRTNR